MFRCRALKDGGRWLQLQRCAMHLALLRTLNKPLACGWSCYQLVWGLAGMPVSWKVNSVSGRSVHIVIVWEADSQRKSRKHNARLAYL